MKLLRVHHIFFGLSLLALLALGGWWTAHFLRTVELERESRLFELTHTTVVTALMLGQGSVRPPLGPLAGSDTLEVVAATAARPDRTPSLIIPHFPDLAIEATAATISAIEARSQRRRIMAIGEGSLLFVLLAVCVVMLWWLVREERRNVGRMQTFLHAVSHEMKTPLTGIKSMLQTFAAGKVPAAEQSRLFALGLKESERLEHMIENVLLSGRLRDGALEVHNEPIELRAFLDQFVDHRRRYLIDRPDAIQLAWECMSAVPRVQADFHALGVVLENLVDNAFKYGGDRPRVTLRVQDAGRGVRIAVEDQGIGFAPARAEELFAPFHRDASTKSGVQHGTGLGLTLARTLAEKMGGTLTAHSAGQDRGSRFALTLQGAA